MKRTLHHSCQPSAEPAALATGALSFWSPAFFLSLPLPPKLGHGYTSLINAGGRGPGGSARQCGGGPGAGGSGPAGPSVHNPAAALPSRRRPERGRREGRGSKGVSPLPAPGRVGRGAEEVTGVLGRAGGGGIGAGPVWRRRRCPR